MRWSERDKRDREDFETWKALPLNERYAWRRIAITGTVIAVALIASSRPHAANDQPRSERLFDHSAVR